MYIIIGFFVKNVIFVLIKILIISILSIFTNFNKTISKYLRYLLLIRLELFAVNENEEAFLIFLNFIAIGSNTDSFFRSLIFYLSREALIRKSINLHRKKSDNS